MVIRRSGRIIALRQKTYLYFLCLIFSICCPRALWSQELSVLAEMEKELTIHGLKAFLLRAESEGWKSPAIRSEWSVDRVDPSHKGEIAIARAERDFGLHLLDAIDAWASKVSYLKGDDALSVAEDLYDLVCWLLDADGYGNLFLARRACDVSVVFLAPLIADLQTNIDRPARILNDWEALLSDEGRIARVLNAEARYPIFSEVRSRYNICETWDGNQARLAFQKLTEAPQNNGMLKQILNEGRQHWEKRGISLEKRYEYDAFFEDDPLPKVATTRNLWYGKYHGLLAGGIVPKNLLQLQKLRIFREYVGAFPSIPKRKEHPLHPPERVAFKEAWTPYRQQVSGNVYVDAWIAHDRIRKGMFLDQDTILVHQNEIVRKGIVDVKDKP